MGKTLWSLRQVDLFLQQQRKRSVVIFTNSEEIKKIIQEKYGDKVKVEAIKAEEPTSFQQFAKNDDFYRRRCRRIREYIDDMSDMDNPTSLLFWLFYESGDKPVKNHPPQKQAPRK